MRGIEIATALFLMLMAYIVFRWWGGAWDASISLRQQGIPTNKPVEYGTHLYFWLVFGMLVGLAFVLIIGPYNIHDFASNLLGW